MLADFWRPLRLDPGEHRNDFGICEHAFVSRRRRSPRGVTEMKPGRIHEAVVMPEYESASALPCADYERTGNLSPERHCHPSFRQDHTGVPQVPAECCGNPAPTGRPVPFT